MSKSSHYGSKLCLFRVHDCADRAHHGSASTHGSPIYICTKQVERGEMALAAANPAPTFSTFLNAREQVFKQHKGLGAKINDAVFQNLVD